MGESLRQGRTHPSLRDSRPRRNRSFDPRTRTRAAGSVGVRNGFKSSLGQCIPPLAILSGTGAGQEKMTTARISNATHFLQTTYGRAAVLDRRFGHTPSFASPQPPALAAVWHSPRTAQPRFSLWVVRCQLFRLPLLPSAFPLPLPAPCLHCPSGVLRRRGGKISLPEHKNPRVFPRERRPEKKPEFLKSVRCPAFAVRPTRLPLARLKPFSAQACWREACRVDPQIASVGATKVTAQNSADPDPNYLQPAPAKSEPRHTSPRPPAGTERSLVGEQMGQAQAQVSPTRCAGAPPLGEGRG